MNNDLTEFLISVECDPAKYMAKLTRFEALARAARDLRAHDLDPDVTGHKTALYLELDELDGTVGRACCPHKPGEVGTFTSDTPIERVGDMPWLFGPTEETP